MHSSNLQEKKKNLTFFLCIVATLMVYVISGGNISKST